jgi:hypothetical protein
MPCQPGTRCESLRTGSNTAAWEHGKETLWSAILIQLPNRNSRRAFSRPILIRSFSLIGQASNHSAA